MKKLIALVLALTLMFSMVGCSKIVGNEGLIAKARKEINIANADSIELVIAGASVIENQHLFWFVSGNEYQAHRYFPMEFTALDDNEYKFVKEYSAVERGPDIFVVIWGNGYSFIVNNPECQSIRILGYTGEEQIPVEEIPFVYYYNGIPGAYTFLDKNGNEIK